MKRNRTIQYLAYGAGILVLCILFALNDARALRAAKARSDAQKEGGTSSSGEANDDPAKSSKSSARATAPKPATDKDVEKFRRFFLPPIKLEGASIEEAVAAILAAYRETAAATGETAQDLHVDLASARTRKPITCTTPRAPAGTVLRYVAALAGNQTKGSLPNFRLEALSDKADRKGKMDVPPDWAAQVADLLSKGAKMTEAKLPEDPFAPRTTENPAEDDPFSGGPPRVRAKLQELLISQGFNPNLVCQQSGSSFSYENMSEAEQELLAAVTDINSSGGLGPVQLKTDTRVLMLSQAMTDLPGSGAVLGAGDVQLSMRKFSQQKGVDLMSLPSITARAGEIATVELIQEIVTDEAITGWSGLKMVTTAVPYGLGSQVEFALESRPPEGGESQARERITLPENSNGVAVTPVSGGGQLVILQGNTRIDATGNPFAPPP